MASDYLHGVTAVGYGWREKLLTRNAAVTEMSGAEWNSRVRHIPS